MRRTAGCAISSSTTSAASAGALVIRLTTPAGTPGLLEALDDQPVRARRALGGLHHDRVAVGQRRRDRARAEDHRRVPGRDPDDHAGRLAHGAHALAGDVRVDLLIVHGGGVHAGLAQHAGGEHHVEHAPAEGAAGLVGDDLRELGPALLHDLGGALEQLAAPRDRRLRPVLRRLPRPHRPRAARPRAWRPRPPRRPHRCRGCAPRTSAADRRRSTRRRSTDAAARRRKRSWCFSLSRST